MRGYCTNPDPEHTGAHERRNKCEDFREQTGSERHHEESTLERGDENVTID